MQIFNLNISISIYIYDGNYLCDSPQAFIEVDVEVFDRQLRCSVGPGVCVVSAF